MTRPICVKRRTTWTLLTFAGVACLTVASCSSSTSDTESPPSATTGQTAVITPVIASVLAPPIPVPATDGRIHVAYEIVLTNTLAQSATVQSVRSHAGDTVLQELNADDLTTWMRVLGATAPGSVIGPGQSAIVLIDATVDKGATVPQEIENSIGIELAEEKLPLLPKHLSESVATTPVQKSTPVVIKAPLDGPHWLDGNSCCEPTPHRSGISPLNGRLWAPERFAIDFVQLDADGRLYTGDVAKVESYAYYGANVHAVADGKVIAVASDLPEQIAGTTPVGLELDEYAGNHIVQDIGNGRYTLYAHLQTGSNAKLKVGDELTAGDVLGLLGNTGNTDAPHLHFHIMDGPDPLMSNGLPFEIDSFDLESRVATGDNFDQIVAGAKAEYAPNVTAGPRTNESPLYLDIMGFKAGS